MSSIGAIASMKGHGMIMTTSGSKYYKEDFEDYVSDPKETNLFGQECMPVGINDTFMPVKKEGADNLDMAQYNIRDRFGYSQEDSYESDND